MLTDQNASVVEPKRGKTEGALPSRGILIFTPQDLELCIRCFPEPPKRSHRIFLADVYSGLYHRTAVAFAGPVLGSPQAVMVLEKLIALGVRDVVAVGWCGSLQPHVRIGDIVIPLAAVSEEGTSAHYPTALTKPEPASELVGLFRTALKDGIPGVHEGTIWTTDAPYRETVGKVLAYQREGLLAVDMESSALFAVARYRHIQLATVLVVSDDLSSLIWRHGFKEMRFHETREKLIESTLRVLCARAS